MGSQLYLLTKRTFVNAGLHEAGEMVWIDDSVFAPAQDAPMRVKNANVVAEADLDDTHQTEAVQVPVANITVSSPSATQPQGIPAGAVQRGGAWIRPAEPGGLHEILVPATLATDRSLADSFRAAAEQTDNNAKVTADLLKARENDPRYNPAADKSVQLEQNAAFGAGDQRPSEPPQPVDLDAIRDRNTMRAVAEAAGVDVEGWNDRTTLATMKEAIEAKRAETAT